MKIPNDDSLYQVRGINFRLLKVRGSWAILDSLDGNEQILTDAANLPVYKKLTEKEPAGVRYDV